MNIDGRICAEGLLVFGLGGLAIVYLIAPLLDNLLKKVNRKALLLAAIMLISLFSFDQIYSVKHPNTGAGISSGKTKQMAMRIVESKAVRIGGRVNGTADGTYKKSGDSYTAQIPFDEEGNTLTLNCYFKDENLIVEQVLPDEYKDYDVGDPTVYKK